MRKRTFSEISRPADLYQKCEELCESLSEDLKSEQLKGKTVSIKIKTVKFDVRTRAHTVRDYTNDYEDIVRSAFELLKTEIQNCSPQPLRLRLMGVRMSNLLHESLCQGKKQNTIIGAFKRLAKPVVKLEPDKEISTVKDIDMCQTQNQPSVVNQQTGTTGAVADNALGKAHGEAAISSMETDTVDEVKDINDIGNRAKSKLKQSGTAEDSGTSLDMTIDEIKLPSAEGYIAADIVSELDAVVEKPAECTENSVQKHKDINEGLIVSGKEDGEFDRIICDKDMKADEIVPDAKADREKTLILENCASEKKEVSLYSPNVRKTRSGFIRTPVSQARKKKRKGGKRQESAVTYECPVCSLNILCESLQVFNEHVDNCLESGKSDKHGGCDVEKLNVIKQETELNHDIGSKSELKPETVIEKEGTSDAYDSFKTVARETTLYGNLENVYLDSAVEEIKDISCMEIAKEETESTVKLESNDRGLESETDNKDQSELLSSNCNTEGPENSPCYYKSPKEIAQRIDTVENSNTDTHDINSVCDSSLDFDTKINSEHDNVIMLVNGEDSTKVSKVRTHLNTHVDNEFEENRITNDKLTDYQSETGTLLNRTSESEPGAFKGLSLDKWEQTTVNGIELEINNMDGQEMAETESVSVIPISPKIIIKNGAKISDDYITKTDSNLNNKAVTQDGNSMAQILHTKLEFPSCSTQAEKEQFQGKGSGLDKRKYQTVLSDEIEEINDDDIREDETGEDGETEGSLLVCPICNIEQRSVDLNEFNSHVDMCLSRGAISEILKEQKKQDGGTLKRGSAAVTPGSAKAAKRRKTSMPNISKSCRSIASFFQEK